MANAGRFGIYPATFQYNSGADQLDLKQINSVQVSPGANVAAHVPGGAVDPDAQLLAFGDSRIQLQTRDLESVFEAVSIYNGLPVDTEARVRYQQRAVQGTFSGGANHVVIESKLGFLYVDSISASQDEDLGAQCSLTYVPLWDGSNDLITMLKDKLLAEAAGAHTTPAPDHWSTFYLGPVYRNGTEWEGVTNITINPGINFSARRFSGDLYARKGCIVRRDAVVNFTTVKLTQGALDPVHMMLEDETNNFTFYLMRAVECGTREGVAEIKHFQCYLQTSCLSPDQISVANEDDATITFSVRMTNKDVLSVATDSTIP